jgi:hypothetical protein
MVKLGSHRFQGHCGQVEHRTPNIELRILMALRFIDFKQAI